MLSVPKVEPLPTPANPPLCRFVSKGSWWRGLGGGGNYAKCVITRGCVFGPGDWFVTAEAGWMSNATRRSVCQTLPRPTESKPFKSLIIHGVSEVGPPPTMTNARSEPPGSVHGLPIAFHTGRGARASQHLTPIPTNSRKLALAHVRGGSYTKRVCKMTYTDLSGAPSRDHAARLVSANELVALINVLLITHFLIVFHWAPSLSCVTTNSVPHWNRKVTSQLAELSPRNLTHHFFEFSSEPLKRQNKYLISNK